MNTSETQENLVVNLDLVASPDTGGGKDFIAIPNLDEKIASLPNLDEQNGAHQQQQQQQSGNQNTQQNQQAAEQHSVFQSKYLDIIKKKYEDFGVEMPNDITEENFVDKIDELYASNVNRPELHPEVQKFQEAVSKGVNPDEYLKALRGINEVLEMPAEQLVRTSLKQNFGKSEKRPNGWDDEKIETTIKKMESSGFLEIEAEKIRTSYETSKQNASQEMIRQAEARRNEQMQHMNAARDNSIKSSLDYFNKLENINGIPVSQSEKLEFSDQFRYLVTPDEKKGISPLLEMLQSDETLVKVAYFLSKGDAKIKEHITRSKETAKNDFLGKLDPEPKTTQSRSGMPTTEVDLNALAAPSLH